MCIPKCSLNLAELSMIVAARWFSNMCAAGQMNFGKIKNQGNFRKKGRTKKKVSLYERNKSFMLR